MVSEVREIKKIKIVTMIEPKIYIEDCISISINEVVRTARNSGMDFNVIISAMLKTTCELKFTKSKLTFGYRHWFICPDCRARVGKLYLKENVLSCRCCHRLTCRDQSQHRNSYFENVLRPLKSK